MTVQLAQPRDTDTGQTWTLSDAQYQKLLAMLTNMDARTGRRDPHTRH